MSKPILCLMGPTASGKTDIACEWAQILPIEIISVDSAMIYKGMDIGTAKPAPEILTQAPHHLIDICEPTAAYSAATFCEDVRRIVKEIQARNHFPLLVGGTMMYFRALQQGLHALPEADEPLRLQLSQQHQEKGQAYMHAWLAKIDAASAERIHPHDTQRTQRALEVYLLTGKPLSEYFKENALMNAAEFVNFSLFPQDRTWLHHRIAVRFQKMLSAGFLEEVTDLQKRWQVTREMPSMRSVGYRQALDYLEGIVDYSTFMEKGIAATRQLAKRQLTWLRSWPAATHYDPQDPQIAVKLLAQIKKRGWYD